MMLGPRSAPSSPPETPAPAQSTPRARRARGPHPGRGRSGGRAAAGGAVRPAGAGPSPGGGAVAGGPVRRPGAGPWPAARPVVAEILRIDPLEQRVTEREGSVIGDD